MSSNPHANDANKDLCHIVCVGASAGGLEALIALFKSLPKNIHMAFVLIQHLEPQHKSALAEILSRETLLNVREAKNNTRIESSHVYVIPPNTLMAVSRRKLRITARIKRVDGRYLPIDFFMTSLAQDIRKKAIGVILSGTGSDGTQGAKAIKEEGGILFAQDEKTARYFGMPEKAIASGAVDFVSDPKKIAQKLVRLSVPGGRSSFKGAGNRLSKEDNLKRILVLLRDLTGVDFIHYKKATVERRIERQMAFHSIKNYADYYNHLKTNPAEAGTLRKDILIPVTHFFRDPELYAALRKKVFPLIAHKRSPENPIRLWVPACSSGEEVYSLAMYLHEFLEERKIRPYIQIFGTDLSEAHIEKARAALYPQDISSHVSAERLRRFFIKTEEGYKIAKHLRDLCIFAKHDIIGDPPLSNMDIASCRNLLIYLDTFLQQKALSMLHYALKPKGFLVLGTSESVTAAPNLFTAYDKKQKIYAKNIVSRKVMLDSGGQSTSTPRAVFVPRKPKLRQATKKVLPKKAKDPVMIGNTGRDVAKLKKEFARTVERLNALSEEKDTFNEELKAANEEIQSSNEELQSVNEELETSKEELQSTNEELLSLNEELQDKNEELTQLNSDLNNFFSSTNIPIIIVGNDLRIKRFTPAARKMMNLIPTDVGRPIDDIKLNINIVNLEEMLLGVIEDMTLKESEVMDQEGRWYSMRLRPYRTLDNKIDGAIIALIDIDAIKRSREEMLSALNYSQAVIETMREPLIILDQDARVLSANKAFYHAFMVQASEVKNKLIYDIGEHQWDNPKFRIAFKEILSDKTHFNDLEMLFNFPKVGQKTMLLNGRQIKMHGKDQKMILLVIEDITKRKKADAILTRDHKTLEEMVRRKSRELLDLQIKMERERHLSDIGTLAATIAHELRNTLEAINIATYNIKRKAKDPKIKLNLKNIDKMLFEGAQIVNNVLSYSKVKISHFKSIDIAAILNSCILEARDRALGRGITVRSKIDHTKGLFIEADPTQMKETFSNILNNALDAIIKDVGVITVESTMNKSTISIRVSDNGEGIPKENLKMILSPFFTTKAKGTGLGLAVCNQIIKLHDGSLMIKSSVGKGTVVKVALPIHR